MIIGYIWRSWWRHPQRFVRMLVGMILVATVISYFFSLTQTSQGTSQDILQKRWRPAYDIVVRPPGAASISETQKLLEPNYLSGIYGGISFAQYEAIKHMEGVKTAAPLAVMGYSRVGVVFKQVNPNQFKVPGIYRVTQEAVYHGSRQRTVSLTNYFTVGPWVLPSSSSEQTKAYGVDILHPFISTSSHQLVVAVDMEAEAELVGLAKAVLPMGDSRFINSNDRVRTTELGDGYTDTEIPVLLSSYPAFDHDTSYKIERLDLPFGDADSAKQTMENVKENGGAAYLDAQPTAEEVIDYRFGSEDAQRILFTHFTGESPFAAAEEAKREPGEQAYLGGGLREKPSPLHLERVASPFPNRWPHAFQANQTEVRLGEEFQRVTLADPASYANSYRETHFYENPIKKAISLNWIGFYDPLKLEVPKDPGTGLPLETYQPATARFVIDGKGNPVNPPSAYTHSLHPFDLLTQPASILTTLDAAREFIGENAISAIRIKAEGIGAIDPAAEEKLKKLAERIEAETGLKADVIASAVPEPVLIHVMKEGNQEASGWIEQTWMQLGEAVRLFKETMAPDRGIVTLVLLLAVVYVLATRFVTYLSRSQELGLLLVIGWKPSILWRMITLETLLLGGMAAMIVWSVQGFVIVLQGAVLPSPFSFFLAGMTALAVYGVGSLPVPFLLSKVSPQSMLKTGEIQPSAKRFVRVSGVVTMALGNMMGKGARNTLSILAMAIPTGLLFFFLFVTFRLQGILYTSWIGQYIAVEVGPVHFIAILLSLCMAIMITAEMLWQNVAERKHELSLMIALGWRMGDIRRSVLWEGFFCGLAAAVAGGLLGLVVTIGTYGAIDWKEGFLYSCVGLVPIFAGVAGSIGPAQAAMQFSLSQSLRGFYSNRNRMEKRLRVALVLVLGLCLLSSSVSGGWVLQRIMEQTALETAESLVNSSPPEKSKETVQHQANLSSFTPESVPQGSEASYQLSFEMAEEGSFTANARISVKNTSADNWEQLVFYFIPNMFTDKQKAPYLPETAEAVITRLELDGVETAFQLVGDTLSVPLDQRLKPGEQREVKVDYRFTVPHGGLRFTKTSHSYYLAQAYPMLATYHNGWNKHDYLSYSESYHTNHSDFTVSYRLPPGYTFISSSDRDPLPGSQSGEVRVERVKEVFIAVTKEMISLSEVVNGTEIRVFGRETDKRGMEIALQTASKAFGVFTEKIGPYPHKQFDLILDSVASMEYPGIVTIGYSGGMQADSLRHAVIHELAHQWFYAVVSNDPYLDGWLDEGMAELATTLYSYDIEGRGEGSFYFAREALSAQNVSNLPLHEYQNSAIIGTLYGQPVKYLWEMITMYGDEQEGWQFLNAYYRNYAYKQVNTKEFVRFATAYYPISEHYFSKWLRL
ncbi:hypothetical protein NDK47_08365 [Brevibacillus ruminantium]|uniref:ABC transporter permease n=1 Tax=Brevibacillus ruminantium TaxID=2950604 RepID=A0ABY4WJF2_9BACL|nr:M1 family aminopeptidase [Brevibacillus ruminantium]USG67273.1 hypothetical protein NDK47_08365 [Brevibacillus ruminantium]